jgi:hypothetical protein
LAAAAWFGFLRFPKHGLYRILEVLGTPPELLKYKDIYGG